jgi:hypothetical protein
MFRPKPLRPPFDPNLGQPHKLPPTPTLRQLQMQAAHRGRGPGGWQEGGVVDYASNFAAPWHRDAGTMENPSESLMNERARLQQLLQQTTDEAMAQEILMRIREITKELEMEARNFGMAGGGLASLMGI